MNNTPPEILGQWRKEFETYYGLTLTRYSHPLDQARWSSWVHSRQAVRIPLPEKISVGFGTGRSFTYVEIDPLIAAIESAGYSVEVKGE